MAARTASPTHAFDPTPALEHDADNYSPFGYPQDMGSSIDLKGVRFSDPPFMSMSKQARHSIATTNVPLLPPVSSASQLPKHSFPIANPTPGVDITAYMEQCRLLNTQLRQTHDCERKAWDIERSALKFHIAELEQKLNKSRDSKRRSSNDSSSASLHSFRSHSLPVAVNGKHRQRFSSEPTISEQPVWIGPEITRPVTRVFTHNEDANHMPSISEDETLPALSKEISPTSAGPGNVPIPVEQVDKSLDGITLRSAALTSSFDRGFTSPQFVSPARSPSPRPRQEEPLRVDFSNLLSPMDEKLKRHAGHTPMALLDGNLSSDGTSVVLTPKQELPLDPAPTTRPPVRPSENSESYFSFSSDDGNNRKENHREEPQPVHEPQDDPALKGPLMLGTNSKSPESTNFLDSLDAKLTEEKAFQDRNESRLSGNNGDQSSGDQNEGPSADDEMPKLRMKNSRNFGSAFGRM